MCQTHLKTLRNSRVLICKYSFNISQSQAFKSHIERTTANHALLKKQFLFIYYFFLISLHIIFVPRSNITNIN